MISLAIFAFILLFFTLLAGPSVYLFSRFKFVPNIVKKILALLVILVSGCLLLAVPIPIIQLFCFVSMIFAYASLETKKPTRLN